MLRRIFGDGENVLNWSLPLYRAWGIRVRVHLFFIVWVIAQLISSMVQDAMGWRFMAVGMAGLFLLVLLHEYGHCIACRRVGGAADMIMLWPLGGLAYCHPPHHWRPSLLTTLGGPAVNVVLVPVLGVPLYLLAGGDAVWFNPFAPGRAVASLYLLSSGLPSWWLIGLWWLYYMNAALLLFNMLLPMYPMDAGRVLQEVLWRRMGYHRATHVAATVGLVIAGCVGAFALVFRESTLLAIALFGGFYCWGERRRLAMTEPDHPAMAGYDFSRGYAGLPTEDADDAAARRDRERAEQEKLDLILAKIAASGMASLTRSEKRWLRQATERRRRG
ncbi:MAG: hypothetical protein IT437_10350 [Phycisphaerales bacterium]|nr:hypothetical protein [Phycisphaerales bacterium]